MEGSGAMEGRDLSGRLILIVESDIHLVRHLVRSLEEDERAQTAYVTDPCCQVSAARMQKFAWSAALVNNSYRDAVKSLDVPVLLYGPETDVPARADAITDALKGWLLPRC
jgi:Tfp pilus assembly protein PilW